jgi:hypothetical protein
MSSKNILNRNNHISLNSSLSIPLSMIQCLKRVLILQEEEFIELKEEQVEPQ